MSQQCVNMCKLYTLLCFYYYHQAYHNTELVLAMLKELFNINLIQFLAEWISSRNSLSKPKLAVPHIYEMMVSKLKGWPRGYEGFCYSSTTFISPFLQLVVILVESCTLMPAGHFIFLTWKYWLAEAFSVLSLKTERFFILPVAVFNSSLKSTISKKAWHIYIHTCIQ